MDNETGIEIISGFIFIEMKKLKPKVAYKKKNNIAYQQGTKVEVSIVHQGERRNFFE